MRNSWPSFFGNWSAAHRLFEEAWFQKCKHTFNQLQVFEPTNFKSVLLNSWFHNFAESNKTIWHKSSITTCEFYQCYLIFIVHLSRKSTRYNFCFDPPWNVNKDLKFFFTVLLEEQTFAQKKTFHFFFCLRKKLSRGSFALICSILAFDVCVDIC